MKRHVLLYSSFALIGFIFTGVVLHPVAATDDSYKYLSNFADTLELIQKNYVEETGLPRLVDGAYRGLLEELDPDSFYMDPKALKKFRDSLESKGRVGIGIELSKRHGYAFVLSVLPGSPAEGKVATGDYIRLIDGASTREMSLFEVRERLLGAVGTEVAMKVLRRENLETAQVTAKRAATPYEPLRAADAAPGVRVFRLIRVDDAVVHKLAQEIRAASGLEGVVLDLRSCALGGLADGARLADLFLDSGTLLVVQGKTDETAVKRALARLPAVRREMTPETATAPAAAPSPAAADPKTSPAPAPEVAEGPSYDTFEYRVSASPDTTVWRGPLVVLTDIGTSGPAEVATAALRDAGRATVVGQRSFGRAGIQDLIPFEDGAALHLTIARALSPKGEALLGKGIEPDDVVEPPHDVLKATGTARDTASPAAGPSASPAPGTSAPRKPEKAPDPVLDKALERLKTVDGREKKAA